ncbi:MAG: hypothetical protein D4R77_00070 [Planctomycetaceae bacterium]|nr:MAG: hypothetical protein D4R77_00070 [Planctomycetaceae bacterium]
MIDRETMQKPETFQENWDYRNVHMSNRCMYSIDWTECSILIPPLTNLNSIQSKSKEAGLPKLGNFDPLSLLAHSQDA